MAFRSAIIGTVSILSALLPAAAPVAAACGSARHNHSYNESYYADYDDWDEPYYDTRPNHRSPRNMRRSSMGSNGTNMRGFHCYYKDRNGRCMNYSYRHGQQRNQWDVVYPLTVDPFVTAPYGYEYSSGYYKQWNDPYEYSHYGW